MLEDADISYIAARYSLLEPLPLPLSAGEEGDGERRGGQEGFGGEEEEEQEVIGECSDLASGEQHPSGAGSSSSRSRRQNPVQASLPNTVRGGIALLLTTGDIAAAAELASGRGVASSQNTLIGPSATQQTDRVSSTHTGIRIHCDA